MENGTKKRRREATAEVERNAIEEVAQPIIREERVQKTVDGYTVGKQYTVVCSGGIWLRETPGGKKVKAVSYGEKVTCIDLVTISGNTYMQIHGGWIAALYNGSRLVK